MNRYKQIIKKVTSILIIATYILLTFFGTGLALSDAQLKYLNLGIRYFDPTESSTVCTTSVVQSSTSSNLTYSGKEILSATEIQKVSNNKAVYQQVADQVGIPWQLIAAVHYRETGFDTSSPKIGNIADGVYQVTDPSSRTAGAYPTTPGQKLTAEQFLQETIDAANFIKNKESSLNVNPDAATIKKALVLYNGEPSKYVDQAVALGFSSNEGYEGSPYVMNFAAANRDPTTAAPGTWMQAKNSTEYMPATTQRGAFLVYSSLSGSLSAGGCTSNSCSSPTSNSTVGLSQVRQDAVCVAMQELQKWSSGQIKPGGYLDYSQNVPQDWCADFVSWVYEQAKYPLQPDPNWRASSVVSVYNIGTSNQNFHYHSVEGYTPKPGDLAIHSTAQDPYYHINMVIAVNGDRMTTVGGNQSSNDKNLSNVSQIESDFTSGGKVNGFVTPD